MRFRLVEDRSMYTLTWLSKQFVAAGSLIVTDEWKNYNALVHEGYVHERTNHSENYVNLIVGTTHKE